jgi:hypothetical protein
VSEQAWFGMLLRTMSIEQKVVNDLYMQSIVGALRCYLKAISTRSCGPQLSLHAGSIYDFASGSVPLSAVDNALV